MGTPCAPAVWSIGGRTVARWPSFPGCRHNSRWHGHGCALAGDRGPATADLGVATVVLADAIGVVEVAEDVTTGLLEDPGSPGTCRCTGVLEAARPLLGRLLLSRRSRRRSQSLKRTGRRTIRRSWFLYFSSRTSCFQPPHLAAPLLICNTISCWSIFYRSILQGDLDYYGTARTMRVLNHLHRLDVRVLPRGRGLRFGSSSLSRPPGASSVGTK